MIKHKNSLRQLRMKVMMARKSSDKSAGALRRLSIFTGSKIRPPV
jgi:hypothetical protein